MTTTTTWTVTAMDCYSQAGDNAAVVFRIHWTCSGTDGTYDSSVYSTCVVPAPSGAFTPYADLTQDQVLGWIWANDVDKDVIEAMVAQQIADQANPPITTPPLPWVN